jgi:uncharacterized protein
LIRFTEIIERFIKPNLEKIELQKNTQHVAPSITKASAQYYMEKLGLEINYHGGHSAVNYKSEEIVTPLQQDQDQEAFCTAGSSMYLLLQSQDSYYWNQAKSDEILHYYDGNSCATVHILEQGVLKTKLLGNPLTTQHAEFQVVIKAGDTFAIEVINKNSFCLLGCTKSFGLVKDRLLVDQNQLISQYPMHANLIARANGNANKPSLVRQIVGYSALTAFVGFGLYSLFSNKNTTPKLPLENLAATFKL